MSSAQTIGAGASRMPPTATTPTPHHERSDATTSDYHGDAEVNESDGECQGLPVGVSIGRDVEESAATAHRAGNRAGAGAGAGAAAGAAAGAGAAAEAAAGVAAGLGLVEEAARALVERRNDLQKAPRQGQTRWLKVLAELERVSKPLAFTVRMPEATFRARVFWRRHSFR